MLKHTVRVGRVVVGLILLVLGVILSLPFVPGPGVLLFVVGLGFLSHEFEWARRLRDWGHQQLHRYTGKRHAG